MNRIISLIITAAALICPAVASAQTVDSLEVYSEFSPEPTGNILDQKVIVGNDTVSIILPQRNFNDFFDFCFQIS